MEVRICTDAHGKCGLCGQRISGNSLSLRGGSCGYHLLCYRAPVSKLIYDTPLSTSQKDTIKTWLQTLNAPTSPCHGSSSVRRAFLTVFSYLTIQETESIASVSRLFLSLSRADELWYNRYVTHYDPLQTQSCAYRSLFKDRWSHSCWHCGKLVPVPGNLHPVSHKPLCKSCLDTPECRLISLESYCMQKKIDLSLCERLSLPSFQLGKKKHGYICQLAPRFVSYATHRKALLTSLLHQRGVSVSFDDCDLVSYYRDLTDTGYSYEAFFLFCGRDEEKEHLERSVSEYLQNRWEW